MSEQPKKFYVTTPIYYVNARPHIGSAYTTIVADVLARRHRLLGHDVFFLTGTDEHGQKIERSAAKAGIPPQQFTDEVAAAFQTLWDRMGITYTRFIRTTEPAHQAASQQLFRTLYERGHIYLDSYTGAYCVSDEAFVDVPVGTPCPDCGKLTEAVTEENFFFRLSAFQQPLLDLIESGELKIENEGRRNEVLSFVRGGLKDLSVSRSSFSWGIPVPEDVQRKAGATKPHIIYVWLDALTNYISAVGYGDPSAAAQESFAKWWPADLHLMGKEIIRFHCVYWPAFLLAADLPLPKAITAHGWLLFDNDKMSKSKGNIVRVETILEAFGEHVYAKQFPESTKRDRDLFATDVLRYFLLREIPFGQDGSFSFDALVTRYNADLANGYGNLVSRTLSMIGKYFASVVPGAITLPMESTDSEISFTTTASTFIASTLTSLCTTETLAFDSAFVSHTAMIASRMVATVDLFLTEQAPWRDPAGLSGQDVETRRGRILYTAAESIRIITSLLFPILPFATAKAWQQLGLGDAGESARSSKLNNFQWGGLESGTKLGALAPIFPRADKGLAQMMADMENEKNASSNTSLSAERIQNVAAEPVSSTHPAAPPRALDSLAEPSGTLSVGGSTATTTGPDGTPSHTAAAASGIFGSEAAKMPAEASDASAQITIDDFAKVELRVAQIVVCERIPKADKLLRLEVDLGYEKRQILSGIAEWYAPEDLIGRRIVVITNLAPRKMRGLESHGMLLAASEDGGKPVLATFGEDIALGARLK